MKSTWTGLVLVGLLVATARPDGADKKPRPRFTISKETTYVTGPIDKDGLINYESALNKRLGKGVTPKDNANVLLWQAMGPRPEGGSAMPAEFFELMGMKEPPEEGEYFKDTFQYAKEKRKDSPEKLDRQLQDQCEYASERPWTQKQYPELAAWLEANEKPLAIVIQASKRPKYFSPFVSDRTPLGPSGLLNARLTGVAKCREIGRALAVRAMLRVEQGRHDEAWQDVLACHRLGRLVARGATLIEELVGIALDRIASTADLAFLDGAKLDTRQIKRCLLDLQKLPPMPTVAEIVDLGERFVFLDTIMMINRHGVDYLQSVTGGKKPQAPAPPKGHMDHVDWEPALRNANHWYDRIAKAMRFRTRAIREMQLSLAEKEMKGLATTVRSWQGVAQVFIAEGMGAKARGKLIGDVLIGLLVPAMQKVQHAADRMEQDQRNLHIAFAMAAYHRDNGKYPKELAALAPAYLAEVPDDLFSGKALLYRPAAGGYLLYSVGANGRDDQGRSYDDDPPGDDLPVRMPLPKLQPK
jgi:hypothetical protein